jgi:hypothetical protein
MSTMNATRTVSVIRPEVNVPNVAPTLEHRPIVVKPNATTPKNEAVMGQIQVSAVYEQIHTDWVKDQGIGDTMETCFVHSRISVSSG